MAVSLTKIKRSAPVVGDGRAALAAAQQRVARLNLGQAVHGQRLIVLLEGWAGSSRKSVLRLLAGALDPCSTSVHCGDGPDFADDGRHWLAPYWTHLPRSGSSAVFYQGWYRSAVEQRLALSLDKKEWARLTDEINEFEAQQTDHGTLLVKLFFHVEREVQEQRLDERRRDPWTAALDRGGDLTAIVGDDAVATWETVFKATDTRWAPWRLIDGSDTAWAQIEALGIIADVLQAAVPAEPVPAREAEPAVVPRPDPIFS